MYFGDPKNGFNVSVFLARNGIRSFSQSSYYSNENFTEALKEAIRTFKLFKDEEITKIIITKT